MIDLCDRRLGTEVRALGVDDDIHLVENLVSANPRKRKLGYKPSYYVSGNVVVDVVFPFPVAISRVSFTTTCSRQSQAQIWLSRHIPKQMRTEHARDFTLASTISLAPPAPTVTAASTSANLPRGAGPAPLSARGVEKSCQCLRVTVNTFAAERSLGELAVWGDVGVLCKDYLAREKVTRRDIISRIENVKTQIKEAATKEQSQRSQPSTIFVDTTHSSPSSQDDNVDPASSDNIPEEFLDPITRHLMLCPVILPSGNIVDSSTLEKHRQEEEKWGRESSDPFTGIPFQAERAPIHHTSLKQRIEEWRREKGQPDPGWCVGAPQGQGALSQQILENKANRLYPGAKNKRKAVNKSRLKRLQPEPHHTAPEPHHTAPDPCDSKPRKRDRENGTTDSKPKKRNRGMKSNPRDLEPGSKNNPHDLEESTPNLEGRQGAVICISEGEACTAAEENSTGVGGGYSVERTMKLMASHEDRLQLF